MKTEALLLLKWMQEEGVVRFRMREIWRGCLGIACPVVSPPTASLEVFTLFLILIVYDEIISTPSTISFQTSSLISSATEVTESTGSFFLNLNGFQAGRSISQSGVPNETQSSFLTQTSLALSQASCATTQYDTQMPVVDYSQSHFLLSQKHHPSESQA